jgi:hypothetical protein
MTHQYRVTDLLMTELTNPLEGPKKLAEKSRRIEGRGEAVCKHCQKELIPRDYLGGE